MKLPSLDSLIGKANVTFRRFSLALIFAAGGSGSCIMLLHLPLELQESHHYLWNITMSCFIGMLLFIAITLFGERHQASATERIVHRLGGFIFIVVYYLFLPDHFMAISLIRFALFVIGLHLLIAFIPFVRSSELNGFWQYNKITFLRILTAALYSGVLYLGLSLAILAVDQLFKAHVDGKVYGYLWIFIAGIFNTWFFLAGFPSQFADLEARTDYPKGLKIFTQYVLLPLITVYLLILYAYMFKIIITMQWPVGWVSYLVLGFSIAGILSLLLVHPVRNDEDNKWMLAFSRFFYFALFPLIILLFLSIKRRISDYGVTENRYFVLVLALWLVCIAVYFLASKTKNIKLIPLTLCVVAFLTSFGPWGAFTVSRNSQENHLKRLLEKNKMLTDGRISKTTAEISFDDHKEISSVVEYLVEVHGYETLQPFFTQNLDSLVKTDSTAGFRHTRGEVNRILGLMNISYVNRSQESEKGEFIDYRCETMDATDIAGYDYFITELYANKDDLKDTVCCSYALGNKSLSICVDSKKNMISVANQTDSVLVFDISSLISSLKEKKYQDYSSLKSADMTMTSGSDRFAAKIIFKSIYGENRQDTFKLRRIQADIMIKMATEKENEVGERSPQ